MVCKVLQHIGADICKDKIGLCHRLNKKSDRTIVKFCRGKDCAQVMTVNKDLKNLNPTDLDFQTNVKKAMELLKNILVFYR